MYDLIFVAYLIGTLGEIVLILEIHKQYNLLLFTNRCMEYIYEFSCRYDVLYKIIVLALIVLIISIGPLIMDVFIALALLNSFTCGLLNPPENTTTVYPADIQPSNPIVVYPEAVNPIIVPVTIVPVQADSKV